MNKLLSLMVLISFYLVLDTILTNAHSRMYDPDVDSQKMVRNEKGAPELSQYDFLIGDWDVEITMKRPNSEDFVYHAKWQNHWINDGYVVMQEWRGPYSTGTELRAFETKSGKWVGQNIYSPGPAGWYQNIAEMVGKEMIVTTVKKDKSGKDFLNKEIYFNITENSFEIRTATSADHGITWGEGNYNLTANRIEPAKP